MGSASEGTEGLRFPILIGDIGGTNARFALLRDARAEPETFPIVQTADFPNIDDAIRAAVFRNTTERPATAVLAVAGPVDGDEIDLTNCPWVVRPRTLIADLGFSEVLVLNDFEAQALAVSALPESGRQAIGGGTVREGASRVVVGPGTGLGVGALVHARGMWIPWRARAAMSIWARARRATARSGRISRPSPGASRASRSCPARPRQPLPRDLRGRRGRADPSDARLRDRGRAQRRDGQSGEAVQLFAEYLGRLAGDLALLFMARGGVYIAGGIFQRIIPIVHAPEMRAAFDDKAPHEALMRDIPLFVITQPLAALVGLAAYARSPQGYGLETAGRRWVG